MARVASFSPEPEKFDKYKSLRTHAREAAEYLTGLPYKQPKTQNLTGIQNLVVGLAGSLLTNGTL